MGLFNKLFGSEGKKQDSGAKHTEEHHSVANTSTMAIDPVCEMEIDLKEAAAKTEYQGITYYFCSEWCETQFTKDPAKYISGQAPDKHSHGKGCC